MASKLDGVLARLGLRQRVVAVAWHGDPGRSIMSPRGAEAEWTWGGLGLAADLVQGCSTAARQHGSRGQASSAGGDGKGWEGMRGDANWEVETGNTLCLLLCPPNWAKGRGARIGLHWLWACSSRSSR
jgi:hypothetical protein